MRLSAENTGDVPWAWIRKLDYMVQDPTPTPDGSLPVELLPWLYISHEKSALNESKLKIIGITHVLSMNAMPSYHQKQVAEYYRARDIEHVRVSAEDEEGYNLIEKHWDECYNFLNNALASEGSKIRVHCSAGINRSALIACAAYRFWEKKDVLYVVKDCFEKRGCIFTNKSFQKELCIFAARHNLLGDKPEGFADDPIKPNELPPPPRRALDRLL